MSRAESQWEPKPDSDLFHESEEEEEEKIPEYYFEEDGDGREIGKLYRMPDGSYEWLYELDMKKNNSILKVVLIAIAASCIPILLMMVFLNFRDGFDPMMNLVTFGSILAAILIGLICYWMVGVRYRWSYFMVYRMDEEGISFRQVKGQKKQTAEAGRAIALLGAASGSIGAVSAGMGMADNSSLSKFKDVKKISLNRYTNQIDVISPFLVNMVYVTDEYYDFVLDYLVRHCPDASVKSD